MKTTKSEFDKIVRKELAGYNSTAHSEDRLSLIDWLGEMNSLYSEKYGISYDFDGGEYHYETSNENFKGDDMCDACFCQCEANDEGLCPDCADIEIVE